jgi:Mitochondrial small ribosomal subunit Rsm22
LFADIAQHTLLHAPLAWGPGVERGNCPHTQQQAAESPGNPRAGTLAPGMDFDWTTLEELRASYLDGSAGAADYWKSESLLRGYDATFARRIAWKWHWVLRELDRRGWSPPPGTLCDYGCGTGVAGREVLAHYGAERFTAAALHDRSARALKFAAEAVQREHPGLTVEPRLPESCGLLVVSHVLPELDGPGTAALMRMAEQAQAVLLVEPGTQAVSAKLVALREQLRGDFRVVAPCTHSEQCGLTRPGHEEDWCHFFAPPPREVYTNSDWVHFGRTMGIDLRALPLSFLLLDRRAPAPLTADTVRVVGSPRFYKGYALLDGCSSAGVKERRLMKRVDPKFFRALNKEKVPTLQRWELHGGDITGVQPVE